MEKPRTQKLGKKQLYAIISASAILLVGITVAIAVASAKPQMANTGTASKSQSSVENSVNVSESDINTDVPTNSTNQPTQSSGTPSAIVPEEPVATQIVFETPVVGGTVLNEYVAAGVVYNKTLQKYSAHMWVDFTGPEKAQVVAVYDGEIASIETAYLTGTTIVINHGGELQTLYNSIEVDENLSVGQTVQKGDVLGVISTNNLQESKDGAHLHFEVLEGGVKVDPYKYLSAEEK